MTRLLDAVMRPVFAWLDWLVDRVNDAFDWDDGYDSDEDPLCEERA